MTERRITMGEVVTAFDDNRVIECFGVGTACTISPVNRIVYGDRTLVFSDRKSNLATRLLKTLTDIQYGNVSKPEWQVVF